MLFAHVVGAHAALRFANARSAALRFSFISPTSSAQRGAIRSIISCFGAAAVRHRAGPCLRRILPAPKAHLLLTPSPTPTRCIGEGAQLVGVISRRNFSTNAAVSASSSSSSSMVVIISSLVDGGSGTKPIRALCGLMGSVSSPLRRLGSPKPKLHSMKKLGALQHQEMRLTERPQPCLPPHSQLEPKQRQTTRQCWRPPQTARRRPLAHLWPRQAAIHLEASHTNSTRGRME